MVQVCLCRDAVNITSIGVDRSEIGLPFFVFHVHGAIISKEHGIAAVARWHHTVEHVYTSFYCLKDVLRSTYPHEVAWTVLGKYLVYNLNHLIHHLRWLPDSQSANGVTVGTLVSYKHSGLASKVFKRAPLHDREEALLVSVQRFSLIKVLNTTVKPSLCHRKTLLCILIIALSWGTFVERHHNIGTDNTLCIHYIFRSKEMLRAINVRTKHTSFLRQFSDTSE